MKFIFLILIIFITTNCSKHKTVLICGDHACVNKTEAEQYFEENLTIEVKIIDKKIEKKIDLVELNLNKNHDGKKKISVISKTDTKKKLKTLSEKDVIDIKAKLKNKKKNKKTVKKVDSKLQKEKNKNKNENATSGQIIKQKSNKIIQKDMIKKKNEVVDVCTILEKCSIDEISKYLIDRGKKKSFPDITIRQ